MRGRGGGVGTKRLEVSGGIQYEAREVRTYDNLFQSRMINV